MKKVFKIKSETLTKKEQINELKKEGHTNISYSGHERGFYVNKL